MILPDVNVLVGAFRADAPHHAQLRRWLKSAVAGVEDLGLTDAVLAGTLRVLTHPRVFVNPTPLDDALAQVAALRDADGVVRVTPGPRHWETVERLCRAADARGNLVVAAQRAAVAIELGATWVTLDRDFARFPGLRWVSPLDAAPQA
jgi:toxin-antitoxin system PIN domain toxin